MKTHKDYYESPFCKVFKIEIQGIVCESPTETVTEDPDEEIPWDED